MTAPSIVSVQSAPLVTTNTDVYTVPAGRRAKVHILVSMQSGGDITIRIKKGGAHTSADYLTYNWTLSANTPAQFPDTGVAVLLTSADVVVIYSTVADTVIFVNGYEDDIPT